MDTADSSEREAETVALEADAESGTAQHPVGSIGKYRIHREIGRGGMGTVYLAQRRDYEYEQLVAVKILQETSTSSEIVQRFRTERQILANLDHPNIARILDGGTTAEGRLFYVMEYVEGQKLTRYCADDKLSLESKLRLFRSVLSAVQSAHQSLIVHRDLKPENILVTADGIPKLLDFGIAKILEPDSFAQNVGKTRAGSSPMTLVYAAPEQLTGRPVSTATDVYSLGVLLFEILTGELPYSPEPANTHALVHAICREQPMRPGRAAPDSGIPRDVDAIVLKALEKSPEERYPSAAAMAEDIERFLSGHPVLARQAGTGYRLRKFIGRHQLGVAASVLAIASLLAFTTVLAVQNRRVIEERDRALREVAKSRAVKVENLNQVGRLFLAARQLDDGALAFERALEMTGSDDGPNRRARFESLTGLAATALARGDPAGAVELFERGFSVLGSGFRSTDVEVAATRSDYGAALLESGRLEEAGVALEKAKQVLVAGRDFEGERLALERLALLAERRRDAAAASEGGIP